MTVSIMCMPWCAQHFGETCFSERNKADSADACLVRNSLDGITRIMVYARDPKCFRYHGIVQVDPRDARDLAELLRALGHDDLFRAIKRTVHEAEAFSRFS